MSQDDCDYEYIEQLVYRVQNGEIEAKDQLARRVKYFIRSIVKKYHINSYRRRDKVSEGYEIMFRCIKDYDVKRGKFFPFIRICINNHFANLLKATKKGEFKDGKKTLIIDEKLENVLFYEMDYPEDILYEKFNIEVLRKALRSLNEKELELIRYRYYEKKTLKTYAKDKCIDYSTAIRRNKAVLEKLKKLINKELKNYRDWLKICKKRGWNNSASQIF